MPCGTHVCGAASASSPTGWSTASKVHDSRVASLERFLDMFHRHSTRHACATFRAACYRLAPMRLVVLNTKLSLGVALVVAIGVAGSGCRAAGAGTQGA